MHSEDPPANAGGVGRSSEKGHPAEVPPSPRGGRLVPCLDDLPQRRCFGRDKLHAAGFPEELVVVHYQ